MQHHAGDELIAAPHGRAAHGHSGNGAACGAAGVCGGTRVVGKVGFLHFVEGEDELLVIVVGSIATHIIPIGKRRGIVRYGQDAVFYGDALRPHGTVSIKALQRGQIKLAGLAHGDLALVAGAIHLSQRGAAAQIQAGELVIVAD